MVEGIVKFIYEGFIGECMGWIGIMLGVVVIL